MNTRMRSPGSQGEHALQEQFGTTSRAESFYDTQMLDHLNQPMQEFIKRQEMVFVSTADSRGQCDCSFRAGLRGFVRVLDRKTLAYPEYRGNGVFASLGNITENPHVGMLFVDFLHDTKGLHVNGNARIIEDDEMRTRDGLPKEVASDIRIEGGRKSDRWVMVEVEEAYIHCSKHVPLLAKRDKEIDWGTDDGRKKGGDYFQIKDRERHP